jgi:ATP-binding cassette subfamily B protein
MEQRAEMNALMNETLNVSGALLVKIFGRGADEVDRFHDRAIRVRDISVRRSLVGRWFRLGMGLVGAVGTALVFWVGGHLVLRGAFSIGTIVAFSTYLTRLYGPLTALTNARVEFATSLVSFERVFEVLDLPMEIQDRPDAVALERAMGHVSFEDVSFSYLGDGEDGTPVGLEEVHRFSRHGATPSRLRGRGRGDGQSRPTSTVSSGDGDGHKGSGWPQPASMDPAGDGQDRRDVALSPPNDQPSWALRDVSFEIQPGQLAALVGASGAGKTTITYLLPRLYDPTEGRITLDGIDLRDIELVSLAANMGMVTQETYLFHDTIAANLAYADPDATQAELEAACRAANIHDFIVGLPEGYETVVGERGYRLSGGEKQRVAIARVILKDPRVLILDEATSHLDSESEALIQHALERVMKGRTSLVIAHRLSTILSADLILVVDEGRLVEQGTHSELLAEGGTYAGLYHAQFWGSEEMLEPAGGSL